MFELSPAYQTRPVSANAITPNRTIREPEGLDVLRVRLGGAHIDSTRDDVFQMSSSIDLAVHGEGTVDDFGVEAGLAEVEAQMYQHPAIEEVCVIGARDPRRGETVKAVVVLAAGHRGTITAQQIIDWAHETMAAYKCPRIVEFTDALPKSGTGKVLWRELQQRQDALDGRAGE